MTNDRILGKLQEQEKEEKSAYETEREHPEVERRCFYAVKVRRRERLKENNIKKWREMENREKKTAMGLTISKSLVTLVSGFSGAAEMKSTLQEEKQ